MTDALDGSTPYAAPGPYAPPKRAYGAPHAGYTGQYPAPVPQAPRLRTVASFVQVALLMCAASDVALIWALLSRVSLIDDIQADPAAVDLPRVNASDHRVQAVGVAQVGVQLLCIVVWLVWFHRARVAAEVHSIGNLRFGRGWAIGSWFVPFLNLVRPVQMTGDILDAVQRPAGSLDSDRRGRTLMGFWWAFWVAGSVFSRVFRVHDDTLDELRDGSYRLVVALGTHVVAAVLAVVLVQRITSASDRRRETASSA